MESESQPPISEPAPSGQGVWRAIWRRLRASSGLSAKLVLGFSLLLVLGVGTCAITFVNRSRAALSDMVGEQARQISQTMAMAAETAYQTGDREELRRLGKDLLKSRNVVLVAFYDAHGKPLSLACRDTEFEPDAYAHPGQSVDLMQVRERNLPTVGEFLEVTVPVVPVGRGKLSPWDALAEAMQPRAGAKLMGYVTVGISPHQEQLQLRRVSMLGAASALLVLAVLMPGVLALVHRILAPIRELADAADRIARGDLETQVATARPDEIGLLARSFNTMVKQVRQKQRELQVANRSLAESNIELEMKVRQRTRELEATNRRLSSEIAEKEDFLRAVSHDLNAPLRNISGMAAMLLMKNREKLDPDMVHRLERIQKNVEMETDLIGELLELSRIKTRRQRVEAVKAEDLVRDVVEMFDADLKQRGIAVNFDTPLPRLLCEKARIRQVFQNLIDNAIKYMGDGAAREIGIGCHLGEDEAEFYVRDTGIGILPEDKSKVFYVFRRGRNSAQVKVSGKGVGLASVKSIVETYGGRIWVESEVDRGSTFRFTVNRKFLPDLGGQGEASKMPGGTDIAPEMAAA